MSLTLYFVVAVITLCYLWIKRRYSFWKNRGFLQAEASFPFGSFKGIGTKVTSYEALDVCYKEFKGKAPAIGIYSFFSPNIMPIDPELIKNILGKDFASFQSRGMYYNKKDDPMSANILTLDGQEWKDRRQKFTSMFSSSKMKMMFEILDKIGDKLVNTLGRKITESSEQDMRNWAQRFTADNIGTTAFGIDCCCIEDPNSEFMKYGRRLFDLTTFELIKFFFAVDYPNLARKLGIRFNPKEVADFFYETFIQTFEYREKNKIQRNDFVSMLLELKEQFTRVELAAEAMLVYAAGYETSSTLMTFTLYALALNPEIQQRLRNEITTEIEENDGKLTYEMLFGFKYLDMVINETLRMFPPIADNMRTCNKDYTIPGTNLIIPSGTTVEINTYSLHHDPEYFPEPEKFIPERFSEENIKNIKPSTFLPFGSGPRLCLGMRFGLMQSKMGIAKLITEFSFSACDKTTIPMKFVPSAPFLTPQNGMWLKVEKI
ncbi:hypothetical protein PVAND_000050 [Polypedilum vanderplanki]|uniref:Cytochrome P450 n=1 Tax=Polypedilum vanderplanki TaxID=319348 RepID=A0A9J6BIV8_POLVA|nr:hypothetical protein PVAND_000050 [Polypedilum vanderplanki]